MIFKEKQQLYYVLFSIFILGIGIFSSQKFLMLLCLELASLYFYNQQKSFTIFSSLGGILIAFALLLDVNTDIPKKLIPIEILWKISILNLLFIFGLFLKVLALNFNEKTWQNSLLNLFISIFIFIFYIKFANIQTNLLYYEIIKYSIFCVSMYLILSAVFIKTDTDLGFYLPLIISVTSMMIMLKEPNNMTTGILYFLVNAILTFSIIILTTSAERPKQYQIALILVYLSILGVIPNLNLFIKNNFELTTIVIICSQAIVIPHLFKNIKNLWQD